MRAQHLLGWVNDYEGTPWVAVQFALDDGTQGPMLHLDPADALALGAGLMQAAVSILPARKISPAILDAAAALHAALADVPNATLGLGREWKFPPDA